MMFTELEYVLMLAVAVLLWRNASMKSWAQTEESRANKYARWLVEVAKGEGKVVQTDAGWEFKPKERR
jgi:hypothetical protein